MTKPAERLIEAAQNLSATTHDEHVWAVCNYLMGAEGKICVKCPRRTEGEFGAETRACFAIAEETIQVVNETRVYLPT